MVDSLNPTAGDPVLSDEAFAAAKRQTGIGFAGVALTAADGDKDTARELLRGPLEAIGLLPYETAAGNYHFGQAT